MTDSSSDKQKFKATGSAYYLPEPSYDAELVLVDKGTASGELFRRYWMPIAKSDTIKDLPVQVKALGEELILFRKPDGKVGLVYPRCVHRGTSLLWGKVTDKGIRCCYHGWTFDTDGSCVDQPCEPDHGTKSRGLVRQPWYPVEELYGLVFAYMGPPEKQPPLPRYDLLENIPEGWELLTDDTSIPSGGAGRMPCNWLQHHENGIDPAHVPIVHEHQFPPIMAKAVMTNRFERMTDRVFGNGITKIGPVMLDFKVNIIMPTVRVIPDPLLTNARPDGKSDQISWTLPKDNTDTIIFTVIVKPINGGSSVQEERYNGKKWSDLSFEEHQRFPGDFEAQTGQGKITYHSEEHLVSSDQGIMLLRRLWRESALAVKEGRDPPLVIGPQGHVETTAGAVMMPNPDFVPEADSEA